MMLRLLLFLALPFFAHAQSMPAPTEHQPYTCDNRSRIDLSFSADAEGQALATLHFADEDVSLPQVPAPIGKLYRAGDIRLHLRDNLVIFEDGKGNLRRCRQGLGQPPALASSFIDIAGTVSYDPRILLPAKAILIIRIQDRVHAGKPARTLAEQRLPLGGQSLPIAFQTTIDRDLIGKRSRVTASARIEQSGRPLLVHDRAYPVLENGEPQPIEIRLKKVANARAR